MTPLAVIDLINTRIAELGIGRPEVIRRIGYANAGKGLRRFDALMKGNLEDNPFLLGGLPAALEIPQAAFREVMAESRRQLAQQAKIAAEEVERAWREAFVPHAVIRTERTVPSQITFAALIGIQRLLRIDLDLSRPPVTYVRQALDALLEDQPLRGNGQVAFFGEMLGLFLNLTPDRCIVYDLDGNPQEVLDRAYRIGHGSIKMRGRPVPPVNR